MKILQIINSLHTGGAEKLVADTVPLFQEKGMEMDVLCLKNEATPFWKILAGKSKGKITGLSKGSVYNPLLIFKIIPYLRRYELVHVHLFPALYWVVLAKWLSFSKTKIIFTEHSTNNKRMNNAVFRLADKIIYRGVYKTITISEKVDEKLKTHLQNFPDTKFELIHNGVQISEFIQAKPYPQTDFFEADDFLLIQVSGFKEPKDQPALIRSLAYLPENIKLLLVGDGALRSQNEALVKELNLENRVRFLGVRTDVARLLKTADVVVLSSHYEGLSLSSIEGMAARPFIASDVPGLREIVSGYGLLFKQGDSDDLAKQILKLYHDKNFYRETAEKCLQRARDFDMGKMVNGYAEIYEEICRCCRKKRNL